MTQHKLFWEIFSRMEFFQFIIIFFTWPNTIHSSTWWCDKTKLQMCQFETHCCAVLRFSSWQFILTRTWDHRVTEQGLKTKHPQELGFFLKFAGKWTKPWCTHLCFDWWDCLVDCQKALCGWSMKLGKLERMLSHQDLVCIREETAQK